MRVRWTERVHSDVKRISDHLFEENRDSAPDLIRRIYTAPVRLETFPESGRPGRRLHTRELVVPRLPFILIYDIVGDVVRVLRVLHGAQKWP